MRRGRWAALLLVCLAVLAGTTTDTEPRTEPSGRSGTTKLRRVPHLLEVWRPPDLLGEGWRVLPPKSPAGEAVRAQGGLRRLDVPHDAGGELRTVPGSEPAPRERSEEHTSELQSRGHLVCCLLLEKKERQ